MTQLMPVLERRLRAEITGGVLFDAFSRGRYATDASHYQMTPLGIVLPKTVAEAERLVAIARAEGVSVLPRGGGTSQCGQTVNASLVVDCSRHLDRILELDVAGRRCAVEPGIVLDDLNRALKPHGLWFPVDISTASRATIGGMAANNSCGGRSLRYGTKRDNVLSIDAVLADSSTAHFGPIASDLSDVPASLCDLVKDLLALGAREADEVKARFPKVQRRVGGYNLNSLLSDAPISRISSSARRVRSHFRPVSSSSSGRCSGAALSAPVISAASIRRWRQPQGRKYWSARTRNGRMQSAAGTPQARKHRERAETELQSPLRRGSHDVAAAMAAPEFHLHVSPTQGTEDPTSWTRICPANDAILGPCAVMVAEAHLRIEGCHVQRASAATFLALASILSSALTIADMPTAPEREP